MHPAVSIILPTFNRLSFLRAAIESVFAQTFQDWELIVADDGSDAETRQYLQTVGHIPRVSVLWLQHSGRPSVVRNTALRHATGRYVAFLDSDDAWMPEKLDLQVRSLRASADRKWSHTKYIIVDAAGNPTAWTRRTGGWPTPEGWVLESLVKANFVIALPTVIAHREFLESVNGFDEDLVVCEDAELWLRLAAESEIDAVQKPLAIIRRHGDHHSGKLVREFQDCRTAFEKLLRSGRAARFEPHVRRRYGAVMVGLAKSYAVTGSGREALATLASSIRDYWRYPKCCLQAVEAAALALIPRAAQDWARHLRRKLRA